MLSHLSWVSTSEQTPTAAWGGKGLFLRTTPRSCSISEESQGRSSGRDLEGSVQEECGSSGFAFLQHTGPTVRCAAAAENSGPGPPTTAKHQENTSQLCLRASLVFSLQKKKVWKLPRKIQFLQKFMILYMIPKESTKGW